MITPRTTRLLRVPDLQAMHRAIATLTCADPAHARGSAVLVPTRGAAEQLRRTLENQALEASSAILLPDLITRGEFYERLHERTPGLPPRLTEFEREVIFRRAAMEASDAGTPAPFGLRAGLIVEILAFYDELRRRDKTVDAFERLTVGSLEGSAEVDRGAERLLRLTHFLCAAFRAFDKRIAESGRMDEHNLRARLLGPDAPDSSAYPHVIVTLPDQAADPRGLWMADFDLLARMPGVERLDIVATENLLASGFHQRIHDVLPGIEEAQLESAAPLPVLACPERQPGDDHARWFVSRDREEELVDVARMLKSRPASDVGPAAALERTGVVFQRPLPYLYLARQVFPDAQVPYQALDSLPLAAEPFAAALDLVFAFVLSEGTRASIVELLGSPHWSFDGVNHNDVASVDALLRDVKYLGGWDRLATLATEAGSSDVSTGISERKRSRSRRVAPALRAADSAAMELRAMAEATAASQQVASLLDFIASHERLPGRDDAWHSRHLRARAAILAALESLRDAHSRHDDAPLKPAELIGTIRRWIEGQTFSPRTGTRGVTLVDAPSAAYADLDEVRLVGLVERDWPERGGRSIFYPSSILRDLGWPAEADRLAAARARFHDLLRLAKRRLSVSTFTLEDDAIVSPSAFLEELETSGLPVELVPAPAASRIFLHEGLAEEPVAPGVATGEAAAWLALRLLRSAPEGDAFHGAVGARAKAVYAVSSVERYLECPFKYFAGVVLKLPEERDEESGLTPQERGQFLHDVFETFFSQWQAGGRGAVTTANEADAHAMFAEVAEAKLSALPEADRAMERTHLLGSAAAPGLAERALSFEIEQGGEVIERLLEHALEGEFVFGSGETARRVQLRAKADRIDLMADGTLRVIDYKLGKAPKAGRALQLPVYGVCAEQHLAGRHGRSWMLGRAGYVAFREKNAFTALGSSSTLAQAVDEGQQRFLAAIDGIEQGQFPVKPEEPFLCTWCGYASVCRKDYVGDE